MIAALFTSCTATRKSTQQVQWPKQSQEGPVFIESISTSNATENSASNSSNTSSAQNTTEGNIENFNPVKFKYSVLMNVPVEELNNQKLIDFLETWYGTPYRYGGTTLEGVDCSAFSGHMMHDVFGYSLPRSSKEQYAACKKVNAKKMEFGDLVFFSTKGRISHVGVYLGNNKFAHASTSNGVMISDLNEDYFKRRWAGAGRVEP
jgi:lipoprotein Spr